MYLKKLNDISKEVDGIESKITEIREEIDGIEKVRVIYVYFAYSRLPQCNYDGGADFKYNGTPPCTSTIMWTLCIV